MQRSNIISQAIAIHVGRNGALKIVCFLFLFVFMGCITRQMVYLGMPKNELDIIAKSRIKQHRMVSSANIVEGYIAEINGIIFWMTFDKDERIDKIVIEDPKFRLKSGVAIGDNFSKIKSTYKNYYVVPLVGYGRMVFVEREGIVFGFPWREDDNVTIDDLDKIEWVEFVKTAF